MHIKKKMSLPGIEPGTLSVLDSRDNHYTTETTVILVVNFTAFHHSHRLSVEVIFKTLYAHTYVNTSPHSF